MMKTSPKNNKKNTTCAASVWNISKLMTQRMKREFSRLVNANTYFTKDASKNGSKKILTNCIVQFVNKMLTLLHQDLVQVLDSEL